MHKIKLIATLLIPVLCIFTLLYAVFTAGGTIEFALIDLDRWFSSRWVDANATAPLSQRLIYTAIWLTPIAFGLFAVWSAIRVMILIRQGILFDDRTSRHIRLAGIGTSASGFADFLANLATPTIMSWTNPGGAEPLRWYFDSEAGGLIVCGGAFYLIGWILTEAKRLADENESFV